MKPKIILRIIGILTMLISVGLSVEGYLIWFQLFVTIWIASSIAFDFGLSRSDGINTEKIEE